MLKVAASTPEMQNLAASAAGRHGEMLKVAASTPEMQNLAASAADGCRRMQNLVRINGADPAGFCIPGSPYPAGFCISRSPNPAGLHLAVA